MDKRSKSTQRVEEALARHGIGTVVEEMPGSTRTAQDAAAAVGCTVGQIAKSLVFVSDAGQVVLAVTSGSNRVDPVKLAEHAGAPMRMADPDTVRDATGYAIGGVPPVGLATDVPVFVDEALLAFEAIWAAAGTPRSVFRITPSQLVEATGGRVVDFAAA